VITVLASYALAVSLLVHGALVFAECWGPHGTRDARRAAHVLTDGPLRGALLIGVGFLGIALPLALLMLPWAGARAGAAILALLGLWLWDDLFVRAGQAVPLS
jgi:hypothetical protein